MKRLSLWLIPIVFLGAATYAADKPRLRDPQAGETFELSPDKIEIVQLAPLVVTSINLPRHTKIDEVKQGSKIVQVTFDPDRNTLDIFPTVTEGTTNLTLRSGNKIYTFLLRISSGEAPVYQRTYSAGGNDDEFDALAQGAPPLKPYEIDTISSIKKVERARVDPAYREGLSGFRTIPIGKTYLWNKSPVTLIEVCQFATQDLLVFKIEWTNNTDAVLHLDSSQVEVRAANTAVPVTASQQESERLFPGQVDTIWVFVQGYHFSPRNDWRLRLPPEAESVQRLFAKR